VTAQPVVTALPIRLDASAQEGGLGPMLAELIQQNIDHHPERRAIFDRLRGSVALRSTDAETSVTMGFADDGLTVRDGIQGTPDLTVTADSLTLLELTGAKLRLGLPDPAHASGRTVLRKLASGKLKIKGWGLVRRPSLLMRFTKLLSVARG
jgi:hypothetical protein